MQVAEEDAMLGTVRIHGPQVVVIDLAPIHVFPTHIQDAAIGKRPGRVVLFNVCRERTNV